MMTRRHALKTAAVASAACAALPHALAQTQPAAAAAGSFALPPLPYPVEALEPHIDARTMEIHHGKHHAAYVANLNKAVAEFPNLVKKSVEDLLKDLDAVPEKVRTAVRNSGGGHFNHSLFWQMMKRDSGGEPKGELARAIEMSFGSFSAFKEAFAKAALGQFGSGWAWLIWQAKELKIESSANQDSPVMALDGVAQLPPGQALPEATPETRKMMEDFKRRYGIEAPPPRTILLGLDVWEHAYYLKYQNRRADYVTAWWNVVNWDFVAERYAKLKA